MLSKQFKGHAYAKPVSVIWFGLHLPQPLAPHLSLCHRERGCGYFSHRMESCMHESHFIHGDFPSAQERAWQMRDAREGLFKVAFPKLLSFCFTFKISVMFTFTFLEIGSHLKKLFKEEKQ